MLITFMFSVIFILEISVSVLKLKFMPFQLSFEFYEDLPFCNNFLKRITISSVAIDFKIRKKAITSPHFTFIKAAMSC